MTLVQNDQILCMTNSQQNKINDPQITETRFSDFYDDINWIKGQLNFENLQLFTRVFMLLFWSLWQEGESSVLNFAFCSCNWQIFDSVPK